MTVMSRRHLVVSGLAGAGASLLPGAINEANAATSIRYNLASVNGQVMLKKYAQAVKLMMALPPSNPLSWTFQWYTHAVPTNTTKAAAARLDLRAEPVAEQDAGHRDVEHLPGAFRGLGRAVFLPVAPDVCLLLRGNHPRGAERSQVHAALLELYGRRRATPCRRNSACRTTRYGVRCSGRTAIATSNAGQPIFTGQRFSERSQRFAGDGANSISAGRRDLGLQPDARFRPSWQRACLHRQQPGHGPGALGGERSDLLDASLQYRSHLDELEQCRSRQSRPRRRG